ncbi:MAG: hypothetical protein AB8B55_19275 [Mariniblastus sp.]
MKNKWKTIKFGLLLFALPMVATAAASAHTWIVDSNPVTIDSEKVAFEDAGIGLARVHTVALNANGAVAGRIATINANSTEGLSSLKVFFIQDNKVVNETETNDDGTFLAPAVPEGDYSFIATGENGFAAYGVRVVAGGNGQHNNVMEAAAVSPHSAGVKQILSKNLPQRVAQEILSSSDQDSVKVVGSNRVLLNDGVLKGQVATLAGGINKGAEARVYIIKGNEVLSEQSANEAGSFMVKDLEPGVYGFVAAGPSGFAAVSFQAVDAAEATTVVDGEVGSLVADTEELAVSAEPAVVGNFADPITYQDAIPADIPFDAGYSNSLDVCMTCQQDVGFVGEQLNNYSDVVYSDIGQAAPVEYAGESIGCGCASGGSCGSVGNFSNFSACNSCNSGGGLLSGRRLGGGFGAGLLGGGGGSGLGRLALIGGLTAGIVAIADDDDEEPNPASGFNP